MSTLSLTDERREAARGIVEGSKRLAFYHGVLRDRAIAALLELVSSALSEKGDVETVRCRFLAEVAARAADRRDPLIVPTGVSPWQALLIDRVLFDENPFTHAAEHSGATLPSGLLHLAASDLRVLQKLYSAPDDLAPYLDPDGVLPALVNESAEKNDDPMSSLRKQMILELAQASDWGASAASLAQWIGQAGAGLFGRYIAFRWSPAASGSLIPIPRPELVRPDSLFEYEAERSTVFRNTEKFITRLPAQNVLLYGDRGTGKSATVKAALYAYAPHGVRMVEVPRDALGSIPELLQAVKARGVRIILFVDDLSFEEGDVEYKQLKAVLEGTLEGRPQNVLIYATSNRRHLVQERFSDRRPAADDDVNPRDTIEEKLSLSDRFGLTVIFPSPDQSRYLQIVEGLAEHRGLSVPKDELHRKALQWVVWNNGRSPRAAQRFIDHLESELRLQGVQQ